MTRVELSYYFTAEPHVIKAVHVAACEVAEPFKAEVLPLHPARGDGAQVGLVEIRIDIEREPAFIAGMAPRIPPDIREMKRFSGLLANESIR